MWREIDEVGATWAIPKERMKGRREHVVPLSARCLEILRRRAPCTLTARCCFPALRPVRPWRT